MDNNKYMLRLVGLGKLGFETDKVASSISELTGKEIIKRYSLDGGYGIGYEYDIEGMSKDHFMIVCNAILRIKKELLFDDTIRLKEDRVEANKASGFWDEERNN
jgi:hypothetical protein